MLHQVLLAFFNKICFFLVVSSEKIETVLSCRVICPWDNIWKSSVTLKSGLLIKAEQSFIIHFPIFNAEKVNYIDPNLQIEVVKLSLGWLVNPAVRAVRRAIRRAVRAVRQAVRVVRRAVRAVRRTVRRQNHVFLQKYFFE